MGGRAGRRGDGQGVCLSWPWAGVWGARNNGTEESLRLGQARSCRQEQTLGSQRAASSLGQSIHTGPEPEQGEGLLLPPFPTQQRDLAPCSQGQVWLWLASWSPPCFPTQLSLRAQPGHPAAGVGGLAWAQPPALLSTLSLIVSPSPPSSSSLRLNSFPAVAKGNVSSGDEGLAPCILGPSSACRSSQGITAPGMWALRDRDVPILVASRSGPAQRLPVK